MKEIPLTQGKVALVDDADYDNVAKYQWYAKSSYHQWYAVRHGYTTEGKRPCFLMHRAIMEACRRQEIDHVNGNGLDNRRCNLRFCTRTENQRNRWSTSGSSQYKGVGWHAQVCKWQAQIQIDGKVRYLGVFLNEEEAACAYDVAAHQYFGEFARCNFPDARGVLK